VVVITAVFSTSLPPFVIYQTDLRGTFDMGTAAPRRWSWTRRRSRRHRHHHAARSRAQGRRVKARITSSLRSRWQSCPSPVSCRWPPATQRRAQLEPAPPQPHARQLRPRCWTPSNWLSREPTFGSVVEEPCKQRSAPPPSPTSVDSLLATWLQTRRIDDSPIAIAQRCMTIGRISAQSSTVITLQSKGAHFSTRRFFGAFATLLEVLEVVLTSSRRVKKGPGRRPRSPSVSGSWSCGLAGGVCGRRLARWLRGHKTYRNDVVVGFGTPLDRLAVRQTVVPPTDLFETTCSLLDRSRQSISATLLLPAVLVGSRCLMSHMRAFQSTNQATTWVSGIRTEAAYEEDAAGRFVARAAQATY
jgi:hypothetical protein